MKGVVVVDANLLTLLVVGSASRKYIVKHKRLRNQYSEYDFELLALLIAEFSEIVLIPHILAEVSSLARQIENPARAAIQSAFRTLIATTPELPIASVAGADRDEFIELGLTDSVILHLCNMSVNGIDPTLITSDSDLADRALSLGYSVVDYRREFQSRWS